MTGSLQEKADQYAARMNGRFSQMLKNSFDRLIEEEVNKIRVDFYSAADSFCAFHVMQCLDASGALELKVTFVGSESFFKETK